MTNKGFDERRQVYLLRYTAHGVNIDVIQRMASLRPGQILCVIAVQCTLAFIFYLVHKVKSSTAPNSLSSELRISRYHPVSVVPSARNLRVKQLRPQQEEAMELVGKVPDLDRLAAGRTVLMACVVNQFDGAMLEEFDEFCCVSLALRGRDSECLQLLCRWDHTFTAFQDFQLFRYGALLSNRALLWSRVLLSGRAFLLGRRTRCEVLIVSIIIKPGLLSPCDASCRYATRRARATPREWKCGCAKRWFGLAGGRSIRRLCGGRQRRT
jgi:hypothetical protein